MKRRELLQGVFVVSVVTACGKDEPTPMNVDLSGLPIRYSHIPALSGEPPDVGLIHRLLDTLRNAYESIGENVTSTLQPSIGELRLRERCHWFPGPIPSEIFALYSWRGGQEPETEEGAAPFWFRDVFFITPERAEREYKSMMSSYGSMLRPGTIGVDLEYCFPFAAFSGGWYVFPTRGQAIDPHHPRAIISVLQGVDVFFHSLELMLKTCIEWVEDPDYKPRSKNWGDLEMKAWEKYNPGVFAPEIR